jgi:hypothetical protein
MNLHPSRTRETRSEAIRGKRIRKHFQMMVFYAERIVRKREMTKCQKGLTGEALRGNVCAKRLVQDRLDERDSAEV